MDLRGLVLALSLPLLGCDSSAPTTCPAGRQVACECTAGVSGTQACSGDGVAFGACQCSGAAGGGGAASSSATGSGGDGGSAPDCHGCRAVTVPKLLALDASCPAFEIYQDFLACACTSNMPPGCASYCAGGEFTADCIAAIDHGDAYAGGRIVDCKSAFGLCNEDTTP